MRDFDPTYDRSGSTSDDGRAKLAINLILGLNRLALAEGLVFALRLGLACIRQGEGNLDNSAEEIRRRTAP